MRIVETDNFGGDYPDEKFVFYSHSSKERMEALAKEINDLFCSGDYSPRFWKVVDNDYKLSPGFEP